MKCLKLGHNRSGLEMLSSVEHVSVVLRGSGIIGRIHVEYTMEGEYIPVSNFWFQADHPRSGIVKSYGGICNGI